MKQVKKAVIPAAGHGTRLLPITKAVPKEMLAIVDKPALHYIVEEAVESGIEEILIITSPSKGSIKQYFSTRGHEEEYNKELLELLKRVKIEFVEQEKASGAADAVMMARKFTKDEPFAVMYGDDIVVNDGGRPCVGQLIEGNGKMGTSILGVQECTVEEAMRYAVIEKGKEQGRIVEVKQIIEKPKDVSTLPSKLSSLGRYVLTPDVYDVIEKAPLFNGEKYLTSALNLLVEKGVHAYVFEGKHYDVGDKQGYIKANIEFGIKRFGSSMTDYLKTLI